MKFSTFFRKLHDVVHLIYPILGAIWYGFPSRKIKVIGVTGTDGKSSTVLLATAMLREAGYRVGHFSSISWSDGDTEYPNTLKMTMPGRFFVQQFLAKLVRSGCTHAILEVTSEGVKQYRHACIRFAGIVITNITPEHIERHGNFAAYKATKQRLIKAAGSNGVVVLDVDDSASARIAKQHGVRVVTFGLGDRGDVRASLQKNSFTHTHIRISTGSQLVTAESQLGGPFAPLNILSASALAVACGVSLHYIGRVIEVVQNIPGRFELVGGTPLVIVDYGHTVAALRQLLPYVRTHFPGKIIHVFGAAGGGRDRWKRPILSHLSEIYTDISVLTEENPFDEDPDCILNELRAGFSDQDRVMVEPIRERAVEKAFELAGKDGLVLLTAKGSETVIAGARGTRRPYNEREFVSCLFAS